MRHHGAQVLTSAVITSVTQGSTVTSNTYDAAGQRILRKDANGDAVLYLDGQEIQRQGSALTGTRYYGHGGMAVGMRKQTTSTNVLYWLAGNQQGTILWTMDRSTTVEFYQRYTPFGAPRGAPNQLPGERGFLGQTEDDSTALVYLNARYYDPSIGRFISADPLVQALPQACNPYTYALNSPIRFADPSGLAVNPPDPNKPIIDCSVDFSGYHCFYDWGHLSPAGSYIWQAGDCWFPGGGESRYCSYNGNVFWIQTGGPLDKDGNDPGKFVPGDFWSTQQFFDDYDLCPNGTPIGVKCSGPIIQAAAEAFWAGFMGSLEYVGASTVAQNEAYIDLGIRCREDLMCREALINGGYAALAGALALLGVPAVAALVIGILVDLGIHCIIGCQAEYGGSDSPPTSTTPPTPTPSGIGIYGEHF